MRKVRSGLTNGGASILVLTGANLFVLLCVCVLLTNHLVPRYGCRVSPAESHFVMGRYDRDTAHIVSVAAGDEPRIYDGSMLVQEGVPGFAALLDDWAAATDIPKRVNVVLVFDKAVSSGTVQKLTDMVLTRGFSCSHAAVPALDK
ncbi:MAG: hypothetical protein IJE66_00535 [Akkermansia sp.]|nr:hypothetical protein [Akkermansia sp.]